MKNMNKMVITLIGILLALGSIAQESRKENNYPDTLKIATDENKEMLFAFHQISKDEQYLTNELWVSILNVMESSANASSYDRGVQVRYSKSESGELDEARIEVKPISSNADIFVIGNDGMRHLMSERLEFSIVLPKVFISFFVDDLSELDHFRSQNLETLWKEIRKNEVEFTYRRSLYQAEGQSKYGNFNIDKISTDNPVDFIEFSAGVGLGYYADRFVPDVSYDLSFRFQNRFGKPSTKFGLLYTHHYFMSRNAEDEFDIDLNGFLSAYFAIRTFTEKEYGIGFGYLINQSGDFYTGDTYKLTIYNRKSSKTSLSPELIFTDGFKKAFPALRFGLTF